MNLTHTTLAAFLLLLPVVVFPLLATQKDSDLPEIRRVDFLNFSYHPSGCVREYAGYGFPRTVHVRNGEFKHGLQEESYHGADGRAIQFSIASPEMRWKWRRLLVTRIHWCTSA